jgi:hypothetical protein
MGDSMLFRIVTVLIILFNCYPNPIHADAAELPDFKTINSSTMIIADDKELDPLSTLLAINNCVTSVAKIKNYNDRIVLDQEYENIINNINYENLVADSKLRNLFKEMMTYIVKSKLREGEKDLLLKSYNKNIKRALVDSLSTITIQGFNPASMVISGLTSVGSVYLNYQSSIEKYQDDLESKMWSLEKEKQVDFNELQKDLLDASWTLIQNYKLKDMYSLRQDNIEEFIEIIRNAKNPEIAFRRLKLLVNRMAVYPPFWYYLGVYSKSAGKFEDSLIAFRNFQQVARNIYRKDPFYPSVCMNKIALLNLHADQDEINECLQKIEDNSTKDDWTNYVYLAMQYYLMGDLENACKFLQINIDSNREVDLNKKILSGVSNNTLSREVVNNQIMLLVLKDDTFKNQDILNLYGKNKDEIILNRLFNEVKGIELVALRKVGRNDNLIIRLPQKWLMGTLGYLQDNIFRNKSDNFDLKIFQNNKPIGTFSRDDIVQPSDENINREIDQYRDILKKIDKDEGSSSSANAAQIDLTDISKALQDKITRKKELLQKIDLLESRQKNLKLHKIDYNKDKKSFDIFYKVEMDSIENETVRIVIQHQDDKLDLILKRTNDQTKDLYTTKEYTFTVEYVFFNEKRFLITQNEMIEG